MKERYELRERLGSQSGVEVWRAQDAATGGQVLVKQAEGSAPSLVWEARVLGRLKHPQVVHLLEANVSGPGPVRLILEAIPGETLAQVAGLEALGEADFRLVAASLLEVLGAVHESGVLHLDLAPANVLREPLPGGGMRIRLVDFGLACLVTGEGPPPRRGQGTVGFMAPEHFDGSPLDARSDLYGAGCLFYLLLTQRPPFEAELAPQVVTAQLQGKFTPLADLRPDLPAALRGWVERLMQRHPAQRPESASAALAELLQTEG